MEQELLLEQEAVLAEQAESAEQMAQAVTQSATQTVSQDSAQDVLESALDAVTTQVSEQTHRLLSLEQLKSLVTWQNAARLAVFALTIAVMFAVYKAARNIVNKRMAKKLQQHTKLLIDRAITYTFYILLCMYVLGSFGVNLSAIWGAAGVAGIALGFAAQTSVSNMISGLFVLGEKAMHIGDFVEVDGVTGTVDSIGLLSVMVRTLDNQVVRVPNSTIISDTFKNYSHFPVRRMTYEVPIGYGADLDKALAVLQTAPALCPTVLQDPPPLIYYDSFGQAVTLKFCVWINRSDFYANKTQVITAISRLCRQNDIPLEPSRQKITLSEQ